MVLAHPVGVATEHPQLAATVSRTHCPLIRCRERVRFRRSCSRSRQRSQSDRGCLPLPPPTRRAAVRWRRLCALPRRPVHVTYHVGRHDRADHHRRTSARRPLSSHAHDGAVPGGDFLSQYRQGFRDAPPGFGPLLVPLVGAPSAALIWLVKLRRPSLSGWPRASRCRPIQPVVGSRQARRAACAIRLQRAPSAHACRRARRRVGTTRCPPHRARPAQVRPVPAHPRGRA